MKKLGLLVLIISMFVNISVINVKAEEVSGLSEKLDALIMEKNFTQEQFEEMDRQYLKDYDDWFWNDYLEPTKELGKMHMLTDEEEYEYCLERQRPKYSDGILISQINTKKYKQQYAQNNVFDYLFFDMTMYWAVLNNNSYGISAFFSTDGRIINVEEITITQDMVDFLKDKKDLQDMLLQKGENAVDELKICPINHRWTILYIRCGVNEYSIVLYYSNGSNRVYQNNLEKYKLYSLKEMFEIVEAQRKEDWHQYYKEPQTKPTYTTEAESLQADGLLNGNEKGLDLLKPLTRIEATVMLVRAMGYEDAQTSGTSYFSDIQSDNWGAKYANIAKDKGIAAGVGDNMFAPDELITSNQFATLILRNTGENPDWQTAINDLIDRGIITSEQADKMDLFTRGDMAKIIYEAKQKGLL